MQTEKERVIGEKEKVIADSIADIERELKDLDNQQSPQENSSYKNKSKVNLSELIGVSNDNEAEHDEDIFLTPKQVKVEKLDRSKIVPTGLKQLDKRIMGISKGELCIVSGSNGSGKSSVVSQFSVNAIDNGFKVAIFSGELTSSNLLNWVLLQCAGKKNTVSTQYENFYTVSDETRDKIKDWLEGNLYIYNNDYGLRVEKVISAIDNSIGKYKLDVLVIDNLMSLSLENIAGEKYDKQSSLVLALSQLAKKRNVAIYFIAHPKKTNFFIRKQDISGSSDISNLADKVWIIHRCNTDFKRSIKEFLGIKDDNPLLRYDNVIEVCKDRATGVSDEFIGTIFEKESKRFLNYEGEIVHLGWEKDKDKNGFIKTDNIELPFD